MAFEWVRGERTLIELPLDASTAALVQGQVITEDDATAGYFKEVDALAESCRGVVVNKVASPATDGDKSVVVDVSRHSVYRVSPDAGSVALTDQMETCDIGADGLTINIDGSTTDDIEILNVDTGANVAYVRFNFSLSGVA